MQLFNHLADNVDLGSHLGAHWILKGVPKSTVWNKSKTNEKNEVQETDWKKQDLFIFDVKMGGLRL